MKKNKILFSVILFFSLFLHFSSSVASLVKSSQPQFSVYEAEDAHTIGGAYSVRESGFVVFENDANVIFTVNVEDEDSIHFMNVRYSSRAKSETTMTVHCNGHKQDSLSLVPILEGSWGYYEKHPIQLRRGINTIVLSSSQISLDRIEVSGTVPLAPRGATLPYYEIEAEDATYNGAKIGPDRTYKTLPSEASARMAVSLSQGQYVEFTLTSTVNAWVLRFSIPDTADGSGNTAALGLTVNGKPEKDVTVTSKFSWAYGGYPFSKRPSDGNPHHFYDEVRGWFNQSSATSGSKVRFTSKSSLVITIDLADFYNVPQPYSQPSGFVSIADFGADPSGGKDSTPAFLSAIKTAQADGKGLWIPKGNFLVTTRFTVDKLVVRGAGPWYSTVTATVPYGIGFFGNWAPNPSSNVQLYDFAIVGDTNARIDSQVDSGVGGAFVGTSIVQNVWIEHTKCGMWLDGPFSDLHIVGVTIRNTYADGINLHLGITNVVIEQSIFRNLGDDALAMWSEDRRDIAPDPADKKNVFKFNTIAVPILANGIAIYGGGDNSATDSIVTDTVCEGGGLQASNRFQSVPLFGTTSFARNTIIRTGAPNQDGGQHNGALWFWAQQAVIDGSVILQDIDIIDSSFAGGTFWGSEITGVSLSYVNISGAPFAFEVQGAGGKISTDHVVATDLTKGSIRRCGELDFVAGPGNSGWNTTGKCS